MMGIQQLFFDCFIVMKEEDSKRNKMISLQFKEKIKKKPYSQQIEGTMYTYSLLKKKNQVFFLTNQRLLVLIGARAIAYARNLPENTTLPFYHPEHLPQYKYCLQLSAVVNVSAQDDALLIQFHPESKIAPWEFVCDSRQVAEEWREAIVEAMRVYQMEAANQPIAVNLKRTAGTISERGFNRPLIQEPKLTNTTKSDAHLLPIQTLKIPLGTTVPSTQPRIEKEHPAEQIIPATYGTLTQGQTKSSVREYSPNLKPIQEQNMGQVKSDIVHVTNYAAEYQARKLAQANEREQLQAKQREIPEQKQFSPLANWSQKSSSMVELNASCHWDYQFIKGQDQYTVIQRFKQYIQPLAVRVIQEQALKPEMREYRPIQTNNQGFKYSIEGVELMVSLLELAEISSFNDSSTIVSGKVVKKMRGEFKNSNYILQCTKNKGSFRVPLMMVVTYKGYQVLAKAAVHSSPEYSSAVADLQQEMAQLERDTRVSRELFEDEHNIKVLAADSRWFQKIARAENKARKFDCCFLTDVQHFIPQDLHWNIKDEYVQLRGELMQDEALEGMMLTGGNLSNVLGRSKMATETKQAINSLTDLSATIPARAASLVEDLQNLDCTFTNSEELSSLVHQSGLNMRYLGVLLDLAKSEWLISLLHSEIIARAAKYTLRYELQESMNMGVDSEQKAQQFQVGMVVNWLNRILGVGPDSEGLWRQIIRQAQTSFRATISRDKINVGYFLQALQHHGGFKLRPGLRKTAYFRSNNNFHNSDFLHFTIKSAVYDPNFTDHFSTIRARLDTLSNQNYQYLAAILNIDKRGSLQPYYFFNQTGDELMTYLANWLSPQQAPYLYPSLHNTTPNRTLYELQLTAIKWDLKAERLVEAQRIKNELVEHVTLWLGNSHPILTQLYDLLARYFMASEDRPGPALGYFRSVLTNQEQLLGLNHFKIADSYFALGQAQLHYSRLAEALLSFRKALEIIEQNNQFQSQAFLEASLKIGEVLLLGNSYEEGIKYTQRALALAQQLNTNQKYLEAAQLLARCYEIAQRWQDYANLQQQLISVLSLYSPTLSHFQIVLKLIFLPSLRSVNLRSSQSSQKLLSILTMLPDLAIEQEEAHSFLRGRIEQRLFPWSLLEDLEVCEMMVREIQINGLGRRWKGFQFNDRQPKGLQFLSQFQALRLLIGSNFIQGLLNDK